MLKKSESDCQTKSKEIKTSVGPSGVSDQRLEKGKKMEIKEIIETKNLSQVSVPQNEEGFEVVSLCSGN